MKLVCIPGKRHLVSWPFSNESRWSIPYHGEQGGSGNQAGREAVRDGTVYLVALRVIQ